MTSLVYFDASGKALLLAEESKAEPATAPAAAAYYALVDDDTSINAIYYDLTVGEVAAKTAFPITVSRNLIAGIPAGTLANDAVGGVTIDDGEIRFEADVEETVRVSLDHPHHIYAVVAVETGP